LVLLLPFVAGCFPILHTQEPLGQVAALRSDEWNGLWLDATMFGGDVAGLSGETSGVLAIFVVDANKGILTRRAYSCHPVPPASVNEGLMQMRRSEDGRWYFATQVARDAQGEFKPQRDDHGYRYNGFILRPSTDDMIAYSFDMLAIAALIKQGALTGRVKDADPNLQEPGEIFLGRIGLENYDVLLSEARPFVNWLFPLVLRKLPPELDPCKKGEEAKDHDADRVDSRWTLR